MKLVARIAGVVLLLFVALLVLQWVASESGEVVVLTTSVDAQQEQTRLWVVDLQGSIWLRSGDPASGWYQRIVAQPDIVVERSGASVDYRAVPVVDKRVEVNDLMRAKYGWADQFISMLFGRENATPIRLDPR